MKTTIFQAPVCELKELRNLFIELTEKNCNQHCKHCYINFPLTKNVKDFISMDTIKKALNDTVNENLQCIYLTGAEPMTHPDFNSILRLCLKRCNVCICTNASFINEKKARFLKKVEDESNYEVIFKLSIDHYDELKNDELRGRGSYRQVIHAIKHLVKYSFNPIISVTNYYCEPEPFICQKIIETLNKIGFQANEKNIEIHNCYTKSTKEAENIDFKTDSNPDCKYGRILTTKGVYCCPFLSNDHRGRCGSDFSNYSNKTSLESTYCNTCLQNKRQVFATDFSNFNI